MFNAIRKFIGRLAAGEHTLPALPVDHIDGTRNRIWTHAQHAGSRLLAVLRSDEDFLRHLSRNYPDKQLLLRMCVVDQDVRASIYEIHAEAEIPAFDESWVERGVFNYSYIPRKNAGEVSLLIRDAGPHMYFNLADPLLCWQMSLNADELQEFAPLWVDPARAA